MKMLTTLLPPTSGDARRLPASTSSRAASRVRAHIGYVPQLLSADGALTAYENLLLVGAALSDPARASARRASPRRSR